ncbi:MAG: hypothetical protein ACYSU3_07205 [Planctomycetota bacterium]
MKKIQVKDKSHIRQLLYTECILGIKDNQYKGFGGFQLWWYDKNLCTCGASMFLKIQPSYP